MYHFSWNIFRSLGAAFINSNFFLLINYCISILGGIPPSSKTKKEATNKTKKEEVSRKVSEGKKKAEAEAAAAAAAAAAEVPASEEDQEAEGPRKMSAVLSGTCSKPC